MKGIQTLLKALLNIGRELKYKSLCDRKYRVTSLILLRMLRSTFYEETQTLHCSRALSESFDVASVLAGRKPCVLKPVTHDGSVVVVGMLFFFFFPQKSLP